jgi:hypothetical protein
MNKDTSTLVRNGKTFSDPASSRFVLPLASGHKIESDDEFSNAVPRCTLTRREVNHEQNSF